MQIHGVKLNWKNFWIPLVGFTILSILFYFFGAQYLFYNLSGENIPYYVFLLEHVITTLIYSLPNLFLFMGFPVFFIIRRLFSKNPKKVFYFELPIIFGAYTIYGIFGIIGGLFFGGADPTKIEFWIYVIAPVLFIAIWLSILVTSMYFYYKKFVK